MLRDWIYQFGKSCSRHTGWFSKFWRKLSSAETTKLTLDNSKLVIGVISLGCFWLLLQALRANVMWISSIISCGKRNSIEALTTAGNSQRQWPPAKAFFFRPAFSSRELLHCFHFDWLTSERVRKIRAFSGRPTRFLLFYSVIYDGHGATLPIFCCSLTDEIQWSLTVVV